MKVSEYIKFITSKVGCYYWFGTIGQKSSWSLFYDRKKAYPNQYKNVEDYRKQIENPKQCFDCAGLVKSPFVYPKYNSAYDLGATGIYGKCKVKGPLTSNTKLYDGLLVFKGNDKTKTHVGVYIAGKVYEAKGHKYGVIDDSFNRANWGYWAEYYPIDYTESKTDNTGSNDREQLYISLAKKCIQGYYGNGIIRKKRINGLGYGDIYTKVQNYVNLILAGKVK